MEIEKPFKCSVCNSYFTNEDHLQVHKKLHMSLNLSKGNINHVPDGFVDETPTPTRFFKSCEEVGLFLDLQSVNPFDLQFTKAASATPSTENFDGFNFSTTSSRTGIDDTLNTPQLSTGLQMEPHGFGYPPPTSSVAIPIAASSSSSTSSVQNSRASTTTTITTASSSTNLAAVQAGTATAESPMETISVGCTAEETRLESTTPDNESLSSPQLFTSDDISNSSSNKSQTKLRLNLTPVEKNSASLLHNDSILSSSNNIQRDLYYDEDEDDVLKPVIMCNNKKSRTDGNGKKAELLERNRAAASRSRERRKQWVSMLESRCQKLESALSQTQSEMIKLRTENTLLREEIGKHGNCDVTRAEPSRIQNLLSTVPPPPRDSACQPQPSVIKSLKAISTSNSTASQLGSSNVTATTSSGSITVSTPITPTKAKRGRPKKGCEKRVEGICIPKSSLPKPPAVPLVRLPVRSRETVMPPTKYIKSTDGLLKLAKKRSS